MNGIYTSAIVARRQAAVKAGRIDRVQANTIDRYNCLKAAQAVITAEQVKAARPVRGLFARLLGL